MVRGWAVWFWDNQCASRTISEILIPPVGLWDHLTLESVVLGLFKIRKCDSAIVSVVLRPSVWFLILNVISGNNAGG